MLVAVITETFGKTEIGDLVLIDPKDITINSNVWVRKEYGLWYFWYSRCKTEFQILGEL